MSDSLFSLFFCNGTKISIRYKNGSTFSGTIEDVTESTMTIVSGNCTKMSFDIDNLKNNVLSVSLEAPRNKHQKKTNITEKDDFEPLPNPKSGYLPAMGRIVSVDEIHGTIADISSHEYLFFFRVQLLEDELYKSPNNKLIGLPVLYFIKAANVQSGYEARAIFRSMPLDISINFAKHLMQTAPLNAWGMLQVIKKKTVNNDRIEALLSELIKNDYVRDKQWKYVNPPIFNDTNTVSSPSKKTKSNGLVETGSIIDFVGSWGQVMAKDGSLYSFHIKDIVDDGLKKEVLDFNNRKIKDKNIPIVCSFDEELKTAAFLFKPVPVTQIADTIRRKLRVREMKQARGLLDITMLQFPSEKKLGVLLNQLKEMEEARSSIDEVEFKENSLSLCGRILNKPSDNLGNFKKMGSAKAKNLITFARITDAYIPYKVKYTVADIVDQDYLDGGVRDNTPMVYQLISKKTKPNEEPTFFAKFIHRAMPIPYVISLAEDLLKKQEYEKAWGVAKNIIDQSPNNEVAKSIIKKCEASSKKVPIACSKVFAYAHAADEAYNEGSYAKAIELYHLGEKEGLKLEVFAKRMMECYLFCIEQTKNKDERIKYHDEYITFGLKNVRAIPSEEEEDFHFIVKFYSKIGNHQAAINMIKQRIDIAFSKKNIPNDSLALLYALIVKEYFLIGNQKSIKLAENELKIANYYDSSCRLSVIGTIVSSIYSFVKNDNNINNALYPRFNLSKLFQTYSNSNQITDTIENERNKVLCQLHNCFKTSRAVRLLNCYLYTFMFPNIIDYEWKCTEQRDSSVGNLLYELIDNLSSFISGGDKLLPEIRFAALVSPVASEVLSRIILHINPSIIPQSGEQTTNNKNNDRFYTVFSEWRNQYHNQITQFIENTEELQSINDLDVVLNKIQNFDFGNWMSTSDYSLMENIKSNLVIPLINFRGKLNMTDSYINESINTIENYLNRIERFPTILQISIIKHLLQKLKDLLEKYCSSIHLDEPDPLVVAESYSAIDESGNILVELGVHNKGAKVYPITDISVIPVPNDRYKVEERTLYKKDKNVELKSEEFSIFCFNVQVVETYRNDKSITLWFEVNYIVETKPRSKQCDIQIDIKKDFFKWIGNNPFSNFGKKVENPKMFFGRQGDIDEIIDIICPKEIDSNSSFPARQCLLYGQKRSGKSSVLGFVKKKLVQDERIFCVDVNFLNIDSQSECYYKILNAINTELKNIQDDDEELSDDMPSLNLPFDFTKANYTIEFELFQNYIREFKRSMQKSLNPLWKNKQLFVLIDEFSSVFKAIKDPEKDINERFLENWRVLQEDNTSEFSSILICQDIMQSFLRDYGNTNVLSIFQPKRLTYLKPEYARDLIIQPVISRCNVPDFYLEGSIDRILYYTACSAYYTVIFCYTLLNYVSRNRLSHVTKEDVEIVANEVVISEIIKKDKFDALLLAGEDNRVSVFSKEEVQDILDQIAEVEIANPKGCEPSTLKRRCTDSSFSDADYIKSIVSDLNKRDVIKKDDGRLLLNIKLYLLWYQANKV